MVKGGKVAAVAELHYSKIRNTAFSVISLDLKGSVFFYSACT